MALDRLDAMARTRTTVDPERFQEALGEFVSALVYDLGESPAKVQQTLGRLLTLRSWSTLRPRAGGPFWRRASPSSAASAPT
jgi:hypothetical protein